MTASKARELRRALSLVKGSWRLLGLRALVLLMASIPAALVSFFLAARTASRPYFVSDGPLPAVRLLRLFDGFSLWLPATLISLLIWIICDQLLTAGALKYLEPGESAKQRGPTRVIAKHGPAHLWPFLRLLPLALLANVLGLWAIRAGFVWLAAKGDAAGWTAQTLTFTLTALEGAALLLWFSFVGAWAFWIRVLTVADGRRRVRRSALLVLGVWRRSPLRAGLAFILAPIIVVLATGIVLFFWRQAAPRGAVIALHAAIFAAVLFLRIYLWHWMCRAARSLYGRDEMSPLRDAPDSPLRPLRALLDATKTLLERFKR